jgi:3-hydroxyacyl-[acyl-carrier-protein] dehydratase
VLASLMPGAEGQIAYFASIDRCRFRRPVRPGDQLITEVIVLRARGRLGQMQGTARVDGLVVAEGMFTYWMASLDAGPDGRASATAAAIGPAPGHETRRAGR